MKKILPVAFLSAIAGAATYYYLKQNKDHVDKTIAALEELEHRATQTVEDLAKTVSENEKA